ncbi:hypothetical protein ACPOL_5013 [Acidisarcina polymorpha]|uniref:Glycosyltransferase RgtA/B/C/D-like domain-containing protein n=1 Tax=Acidisarcina polymorpha TaxID=2211140 RepID=A0A2Z5G4Z8_9BACT|nr:glycosyltransferase family 39 protein [Acidisarcina polymorpha]AXC14273.1 hypothetical protein ACPOL_5013 [Acidisarcina polymorpha]
MSFAQRLRKFRFDRPQRIAAVLLLLLFSQCYWVTRHQTLTERDYQYARCGREMWEKPSPLAGYFTSCGNIHDGTLAYRAAGLLLTMERIFSGASSNNSPWELRHQLSDVLLLMRLPFIFCGLCLGAALWWVTRRLFGNEGGFVALSLYCFSPEIVHACTYPNPEILAAFGFFAAVYTAIGVAHAMQGPRRKWRPRIVLLTAALGFTAASHVAAALLAFFVALGFMIYLAERRRSSLIPIALYSAVGTLLILFASYAFRPDAFSYVFRSAAARMWFSLEPAKALFTSLPNAGMTLAAAISLLLFISVKRSRYFGNLAALLVTALLLPIVTTGVPGEPWLWMVPFLLTFIGGVFADALETPQRRIFLIATCGILVMQAALCVASLPRLVN